jgi:hypothetical protein
MSHILTKLIKNLISTPNCAHNFLSFVDHSTFTTLVLVPKKKNSYCAIEKKNAQHFFGPIVEPFIK